jgi:bacterioferritin
VKSQQQGVEMKGSPKVLEMLNEILAHEILGIAQYEAQHYQAEETLALKKLAEMFHEAAMTEMEHMEKLSERIHFLEGTPVMKITGKVAEVGDARSMVADDVQLEYDAIEKLNGFIKVCWEEGDGGSRLLFEEILKDEEEHADKFEDVLHLIDTLGDHYLAELT